MGIKKYLINTKQEFINKMKHFYNKFYAFYNYFTKINKALERIIQVAVADPEINFCERMRFLSMLFQVNLARLTYSNSPNLISGLDIFCQIDIKHDSMHLNSSKNYTQNQVIKE